MTCVAATGGEAMVLSLDAEKVFNRMSWKYLFQTLTWLGFGTILSQGSKFYTGIPELQ